MADDRTYKIANLLLKKTKEGKVQWDLGEDHVSTLVGDVLVRVRAGRPEASMSIYNSDGNRVDLLSGPDVQTLLSSIYREARSVALKIDSSLDGALRILDGE